MNKRYQFIASEKAEQKCPNAWDLYHNMFQDDDEVLVITEYDKVKWGKITAKPTGCWLRSANKHEEFLEWDDIRFLSHDGFPVKKLMGADGSKNIEKLDTKETQELIRKTLAASKIFPKDAVTKLICNHSLNNHCKLRWAEDCIHARPHKRDDCKDYEDQCQKYSARKCIEISPIEKISTRRPKQLVFGDPFLIEDTNAILLNPRNVWQPGGFNDNMYEEIMLLKHKNGTEGMLWGIPTCYYFNPN